MGFRIGTSFGIRSILEPRGGVVRLLGRGESSQPSELLLLDGKAVGNGPVQSNGCQVDFTMSARTIYVMYLARGASESLSWRFATKSAIYVPANRLGSDQIKNVTTSKHDFFACEIDLPSYRPFKGIGGRWASFPHSDQKQVRSE
jgi:hypothetical protein